MSKILLILTTLFGGVVIGLIGFVMGLRYEKYRYLRTVDGDTFFVVSLRDGSEWKVRLLGIDAPAEKTKCGVEAKKKLEDLLTGKRIEIKKAGYDGFGRILASVKAGGVEIEKEMVLNGLARAYGAEDVHDDLRVERKRFEELGNDESWARERMVGLWGEECK